MNKKEFLLSKAISEHSIKIDSENKNYTSPRTFGVYKIEATNTKKYRFGNHPVRENELIREFGNVKRYAIFLSRNDAKELSALLNSQI